VILRLSLVAVVLQLQLGGVARANSTGVTGYYGPSNTCMNCHLPQMRKGTIELTSPARVGKTYTFSFTCADTTGAGGTLPVAGVNIHADCGKLAAVEPGTQIVNGQLIHTQAKPTTQNAKTWQFSWTAPAAPTSCGFTIAGLLGDNNKKATGDVTCLAMKALLVQPPPDAGPPDLPPPARDSSAPAADGAAATGDSGAGHDLTLSDGTTAADRGSRDLQLTGGDGGDGEDDGCGCRLSPRPALPWLIFGVLLGLIWRLRRRGTP
jgi:MYXO-CTERM domain-containing protein